MDRKLKKVALASLSVCFLSACSNGASNEEAIAGKMTQEQELALQKWIQSPIKSCEAIEVVGGGATQISDQLEPSVGMPGFPDSGSAGRTRQRDAIVKGVDLGVLSTRTKGSLWIGERSGLKDFAVLSGASAPFTTGVAESKFEQTLEINGRSQSVKVETKSSGYDCVVSVNGVERAKVKIAKSVEVGLAGGKSSWQVAEFRQRRDQTVSSFGDVLEFKARDLLQPLTKGIQVPASRNIALTSIGYTREEAEQYFPVATSRRPVDLAMESASGGRLILGDYARFVLVGQDRTLLPEGAQTRDVNFSLLMRTENAEIGGQKFRSGVAGVTSLSRVLRLSQDSTSGVAQLVFQDTGFGDTRLEKADDFTADRCVIQRADDEASLYVAKKNVTGSAAVASYQSVFSPCFIFDTSEQDVSVRAESNGLMVKVLNLLFRTISPVGNRFDFGDWAESLVKQIELGIMDVKRPGISELSSGVLENIDELVQHVRRELQGTPLAGGRRASLAEGVLRMAELEQENPRELRTRQVLSGVSRLAAKLDPAFDIPFFELMKTAQRDLAHASVLSRTAEALSPDYLSVAKEAYTEAQAVGHDSYLRNVHSRLFELAPSERELREWALRFRGLRTELQKYPSLSGKAGTLVDALLSSQVSSGDYALWIKAAANLSNGSPDLLIEIVQSIRSGGFNALRDWAMNLSQSDQQGISVFLAEAKKLGQERQAMEKVLVLVRGLAPQGAFSRLPAFAGRANAFIQAEQGRAQGSHRDTFYEARAKELAGRILIEEFDDSEVRALETFAKVAGSDVMCDGRKTIALRLDCVGLERFKKSGNGLLNPKFQGRYMKLALRMETWLGQLVPEMDHRTIRRRLKDGMFPSFGSGIWETCDAQNFDSKFVALDTAVGKYLIALGDFITRSRVEREVSSALDARCL